MKVAAIQLCSVLDFRENLKKIRRFMGMAKKEKVGAIFLPECFYSMSDGTMPTPHLVEEGNEHAQNIRDLAKDFGVFLLGGSAATAIRQEGGKKTIVNRSYNFDPQGHDLGSYDKMHLFRCDLKGKKVDEGRIYAAGDTPVLIEAGPLRLGQSLCFDVRFPHLYWDYACQGANALAVPSAFTVVSGRAHWHILVRARAIENQCFVIAAAQWGRGGPEGRVETFGHSLIVGPWGDVLADAEEGEKIITAQLDLGHLENVRKTIDVKR